MNSAGTDSLMPRTRTLSQSTTYSISEELARDAVELVEESTIGPVGEMREPSTPVGHRAAKLPGT